MRGRFWIALARLFGAIAICAGVLAVVCWQYGSDDD